jgi:hypothetical protein
VNLCTERFTRLFLDFERDLEPSPINVQAEFALIGKEPIRDDVAGYFAIEPENQVAGQ